MASDLDGTIVRPDGTISRRVRGVLARVEAAGVPLVLVTGRPPRWMAQISEQTGHRGLAVCANGALVYDLHTEQVVRSTLLTGEVVAEVAAALREALPGIAFAVERADLTFGHEDAYVPGFPWPDRVRGTAEALSGGGVVKLLARHASLGPDELLARARTTLGERVSLTHSSTDGLLEVSAAGITKASGLAGLAEDHGVPAADVIAFGDMPNDLPMLSWAGWGVAMGNAHPQVLRAAAETTASVQDDGVAEVLERWF
ncbi:MAG: HAD family phosphatase [Geodermatophilaceae bacterium]|nr:HAD family phosphatase [Geodermatophilaceae bacterium]